MTKQEYKDARREERDEQLRFEALCARNPPDDSWIPAILMGVVLLYLFVQEAFAGVPNDPPVDPPVETPINIETNASADAVAKAAAEAAAKATATVQTGDTTATVGDTSQSITIKDRLQAPALFAPSIAPTAPCYYSFGATLSFPGGGLGGGKAVLDEDCQRREKARLWYQMGFTDAAVFLMCQDSDIPGCPYPFGQPKVEPVAPVCPQTDTTNFVTREEMAEREKRMFETCVRK